MWVTSTYGRHDATGGAVARCEWIPVQLFRGQQTIGVSCAVEPFFLITKRHLKVVSGLNGSLTS